MAVWTHIAKDRWLPLLTQTCHLNEGVPAVSVAFVSAAGVQNEVLQAALRRCSHIAAMASEEDDEVIMVERSAGGAASRYTAVFDPLDGSRNIDASIPTGTIFGLYRSSGAAGTLASLPATAHCLSGEALRGCSL